MKSRPPLLRALGLLLAGTWACACPLRAGTLTWDVGAGFDGAGTWDVSGNTSSNLNWFDGTNAGLAYAAGSSVVFGSGGIAGTVTLNGTTTVAGITFNPVSTGSYLLTGGTITGSAFTITTNAAAAEIDSTISNASVFTITTAGTGILTFGGTADNGDMALVVGNGSTVILAKSSGTGHVVGSGLTINSGGLVQIGAGNGDQIYNNTGVTIASGGTLDMRGQSETVGSMTVAGSGIGGNGAITNTGATASTLTAAAGGTGSAGSITLTGAVTVGGTGNITLAGGIGSSGSSINKVGTDTLTLQGTTDDGFLGLTLTSGTVILNKTSSSGTHALGGTTSVAGGALLQLAGTGGFQIFSGATVTVASGGVFDLGGTSEASASTLNLNGTGIGGTGAFINSSSTAGSTAQKIGLASASSISGTGNITLSGVVSGPGSLTKAGGNTLSLGGVNTYTGGTTISAGTVLAANTSGSALGTGAVGVSGGGTLGGTGSVSGLVTVSSGGLLLAGTGAASTGTLTLTGGAALQSGSLIEIALGNAATIHSILALTTGSTFQTNQGFTFLDLGAVAGTTYTGILTGVSTSLDTSLWTVTNAGWSVTFADVGGSINATVNAVPEPGTWALLLGGAALLALPARRRRYFARA